MRAGAAPAVVDVLQRRAIADALHDLTGVRETAAAWGDRESRELILTTVTGTSATRHRPAGRVLRDWYLRVYTQSLDDALGLREQAPVTAQDLEDTAALLRRLQRASTPRLAAFHAAATIHRIARRDALRQAVTGLEALEVGAAARAQSLVPDAARGVQRRRRHILQQWYRRCYLDRLHTEIGTADPLTRVSPAEAAAVAQAVHQGQARRVIGEDGVPLMTPQNTVVTADDRRLAGGEVGVAESETRMVRRLVDDGHVRATVSRLWSASDQPARYELVRRAGIHPVAAEAASFWRLPGVFQTALTTSYVVEHHESLRRELMPEPEVFVQGPVLSGPSHLAAAEMFCQDPLPIPSRGTRPVGGSQGVAAPFSDRTGVRGVGLPQHLAEVMAQIRNLPMDARSAAASQPARPRRTELADRGEHEDGIER